MRGLLAVLLVTTLLAAPARADSSTDARELFERAKLAYDLQHWDDALDRFQAVYGARQDAAILYNIAQCQRHLHRYEEAAISYRLFASRVPDAPQAPQALQLARQMDEEITREHLLPAPPVKTPAPPDKPVVVAPASAPLVPYVSASPSRPDRGRPMRTAGLVTAALGAATLGAGIILAAFAQQAGNDAWHRGTYDYAADQRRDALQAADIAAFTIGGAAVIAGTVTYALGRRRR
jgi:tetratricopeptide (TPR) repeat protein